MSASSSSSFEPKQATLSFEEINEKDLTGYDLILVELYDLADGQLTFDTKSNKVFAFDFEENCCQQEFQLIKPQNGEWTISERTPDALFESVGFPKHKEQILLFVTPFAFQLTNNSTFALLSVNLYNQAMHGTENRLVAGVDFTEAPAIPAELLQKATITVESRKYLQFPGSHYQLALPEFLKRNKDQGIVSRSVKVLVIDGVRYGLNISEQVAEEDEQSSSSPVSSSSSSLSESIELFVRVLFRSDTVQFYLCTLGYDRLTFSCQLDEDVTYQFSPDSDIAPDLHFHYRNLAKESATTITSILRRLHERASGLDNPLVVIKGMTLSISATYLEFLLDQNVHDEPTTDLISRVLMARAKHTKVLDIDKETGECYWQCSMHLYRDYCMSYLKIFTRSPNDFFL